jgi:pyruvate-ferredoxin/flavodoxin oxidoreductase
MQTCFFAISGVLPRDEAIEQDQGGDREDLRQEGRRVVRKNFAAVDARWPTCTR